MNDQKFFRAKAIDNSRLKFRHQLGTHTEINRKRTFVVVTGWLLVDIMLKVVSTQRKLAEFTM